MIEHIFESLLKQGLTPVTGEDRISCKSRLVEFIAKFEAGGLRLEVAIIPGVTPNKLALWNVIHHNNSFLPFGQFYISPDQNVCFGLFIQEVNLPQVNLERIIYELLKTAEGYYRLLKADLLALPFVKSDLHIEAMDLLGSELHAVPCRDAVTKEMACERLGELLVGISGKEGAVELATGEYGITGKSSIIILTIEDLPYYRHSELSTNWFLGVHTEVGTLDKTDAAFWIDVNARNYNEYMLSTSVKYRNRRPVLRLKSCIMPDLALIKGFLTSMIEKHNVVSAEMYAAYQKSYRLESKADFSKLV